MSNDIEHFLDDKGRINAWPARHALKKAVLNYLAIKFEMNRDYKEKEVNAIIEQWHTFGDYFLLRRGLVDYHFLSRTRDGARYWREPIVEESIEMNPET